MEYNANLTEQEWQEWYNNAKTRQQEINRQQEQLDKEFRNMLASRQITQSKNYSDSKGWRHGDSIRLTRRFYDDYNRGKTDYFSQFHNYRGNKYLMLVVPKDSMWHKHFYTTTPSINFTYFGNDMRKSVHYQGNICQSVLVPIEECEPMRFVGMAISDFSNKRYAVKRRLRHTRRQKRAICLQNPFD